MLIFSVAIFVKTLAPRWYPKIAGEWIIIPPTCGNFIGFDVLTHPQLCRQLPLKTTNRDVCWNCFMVDQSRFLAKPKHQASTRTWFEALVLPEWLRATRATRPTSLDQIHQFQFKLSPKILGRPKRI
jgi:hypothetical protein